VPTPTALEFTLLRELEAPRGALVGLHLRHLLPPRFVSVLCLSREDSRHGSSRFVQYLCAIVTKSYSVVRIY
jgi:hypothetical protein